MNVRDVSSSSLQYALAAAAVKRAGRRKRRVAFIVHAPETFSALEPVVEELRRRADRFDLVFIAVPRDLSGGAAKSHAGVEATYLFLDRKGCQPIALNGRSLDDLEVLIRLCPDFIFRQSPWESDIPPAFNSVLLSFAQLCYVPYGLMTVDKPDHQYNQPFHNACDFIFCETEFHRQEFVNRRQLGAQGLHLSGYPRFEQFAAGLADADPVWPLAAPDDVPRVIWAPHHTISARWLGFSTFLDYKDRMLEAARSGGLSILLRPHPALRERLAAEAGIGGDEYDAYLQAFSEAGCSGVDRDPEYLRSFAASDCMITDGVGFFSEYMLTGKPMIRTRRADSVPLNAFGNWLVEACDNVDDATALDTLLDNLGRRCYADAKAALREERRAALVGLADGASRRIVDALEAA